MNAGADMVNKETIFLVMLATFALASIVFGIFALINKPKKLWWAKISEIPLPPRPGQSWNDWRKENNVPPRTFKRADNGKP